MGSWSDFVSTNNVEFKIISCQGEEYFCRFRSMNNPLLFVGTIIKMNSGEEYKVVSCEITNNTYDIKIKGTCVLLLL